MRQAQGAEGIVGLGGAGVVVRGGGEGVREGGGEGRGGIVINSDDP